MLLQKGAKMLLNTAQVRALAKAHAKNVAHTYTDKTSKHNTARRSVVYVFNNMKAADDLFTELWLHFASSNISNALRRTSSETWRDIHYVRVIANIK